MARIPHIRADRDAMIRYHGIRTPSCTCSALIEENGQPISIGRRVLKLRLRAAHGRIPKTDATVLPASPYGSLRGASLEQHWLDGIQDPFQVEILLDAFARRSGLLPEGAYRVRDPKALPAALRELLTRVLAQVWVCFSDGSQAWLLTGMVSVALSRLRNAPVLWVNGYCTDGALIEVGAWAVDPDGRWCRCDNHGTNLNG